MKLTVFGTNFKTMMLSMERFTTVFSLLFIFSLIACSSDLKNKDIEKSAISLPLECKLDSESFGKITEKKISKEFDCLESTLDLFLEAVVLENPDRLPKSTLVNFVNQQLPNSSKGLVKGIKILYAVAELIYDEDGDHLSKDNLKTVIDLGRVINHELIDSYKYIFESKGERSLKWHEDKRKIVVRSVSNIVDAFKKTIIPGSEKVTIDLYDFLHLFINNDNSGRIELIKQGLILRRFVSQSSSIRKLNQENLKNLLDKAVELMPLIFDAVRYKKIKFLNTGDNLNFVNRMLEGLRKSTVFESNPDRIFVTWGELLEVFGVIRKAGINMIDVSAYKEEIEKIKMIFLGNGQADISGSDFLNIFEQVEEQLVKGKYFYKIYSSLEDKLKEGKAGHDTLMKIKNFHSENRNEVLLKKDFLRIIQDYYLFKGTNPFAQFSSEIKRSFSGIFKISIFEDVITKVYRYYERNIPCDSELHFEKNLRCEEKEDYDLTLNQYQIEKIFYDLSGTLGELGISSPGSEPSTAQSLTLVTTLFQFHSNGDALIDVKEMTEFLDITFASIGVAQELYDESKKYCAIEYGGIERNCFYNNFFNILWSSQIEDFKAYFPSLYQFSSHLDQKQTFNYFDKVTRFSVSCHEFSDGSYVPLTKGDIQIIFIALMTIENVILRYDLDGNSLLEWNEIKNAYDATFIGAIEAFLKAPIDQINETIKQIRILKPFEFHSTAYKIFEYLIRKKKAPNTEKIGDLISLGYWLLFKSEEGRKTTGNRDTLASILKVIKEGSKAKLIRDRGVPVINCDYLKER